MAAGCYKFEEFELDGARFELRRNGKTVKLERIPLELLILLAQKNGEVVTRQEIVNRLWGKDVFVDTEHGINTAIRKARTALRDDADRSRYIQTVSGKGYRFIAQLKNGDAGTASLLLPSQPRAPATETLALPQREPAQAPRLTKNKSLITAIAAFVLLAFAAGAFAFNIMGLRSQVFGTHEMRSIHTIAVLPLANLSGDSSQDYYADGMTDELITALARNRSLRVVSRTSAMQYKGVNKSLREIAQVLGADGILEGSVNRSQNHVHVNLQLIYAPTDTHIWAQSYDRDLNAAMSLPEELSQTIAAEAKADSTPAKPQRAINPEAHDAYLQGRYLWFAENGDRGRQYFEKAIQLQPDYAAAWAGLGDSYGEQAAAGEIPPNEGFAKVEENARKALALDSTLPEGHNSMAALYLLNKWDWRQAEVESLRAIELDPNYAEARFIHSLLLLVMNRDDEALEEEKRSNGISPFERPWALGGLYNSLRQYDAAINELQSRANTQQQNAYIHFLLSEVYWLKGRWNDSERELEAAYRLWGNPNLADAVRRAFMRGGGEAVRKLELANILRSSRTQYVPPFSIAVQYAYLRDKEHTLNFLEAACRERSPSVIFLQRDPLFDFLRSDERYRALIRNIGLPLAN